MGGKPRKQLDPNKPFTKPSRGGPKKVYFEQHAEEERDAIADLLRRAAVSVRRSVGSDELSLYSAFFMIVEQGGLRPAWNPKEHELIAELTEQHRVATECERQGIVPPELEQPPAWGRNDCSVPPGAGHQVHPQLIDRLLGSKARIAVLRILEEAVPGSNHGTLCAEQILAHLYRRNARAIRSSIERAVDTRKRREFMVLPSLAPSSPLA